MNSKASSVVLKGFWDRLAPFVETWDRKLHDDGERTRRAVESVKAFLAPRLTAADSEPKDDTRAERLRPGQQDPKRREGIGLRPPSEPPWACCREAVDVLALIAEMKGAAPAESVELGALMSPLRGVPQGAPPRERAATERRVVDRLREYLAAWTPDGAEAPAAAEPAVPAKPPAAPGKPGQIVIAREGANTVFRVDRMDIPLASKLYLGLDALASERGIVTYRMLAEAVEDTRKDYKKTAENWRRDFGEALKPHKIKARDVIKTFKSQGYQLQPWVQCRGYKQADAYSSGGTKDDA